MNLSRAVKKIIIILMTVCCFFMSIMSLYMLYDKEYMSDEFSPPIAVMMFLFFSLCLLISIYANSWWRKENNFIILPMLGLYVVAFVISMAVEFLMEMIGGDQSSIGPAVTFIVLAVILILAIYGVKSSVAAKESNYKKLAQTNNSALWNFNRFSAEWEWETVWEDYQSLVLEQLSAGERAEIDNFDNYFADYLENNPELNDKIYVYACNHIAYLFLWLVKRNGLSENLLSCFEDAHVELEELKAHKENPAEFIYNSMDGKICRDDISAIYVSFLDSYYNSEAFVNGSNKQSIIREVSYERDYDNVVLESMEGGVSHCYCIDFSWEKYNRFEELLNQRFEAWRRNALDFITDLGSYERLEPEGYYSHALSKKMEVNVQMRLLFEEEKEEFYHYVDSCLAEIDTLSEGLLYEICDAFNSWGESWIEADNQLTPALFIERTSPGEIQIYKPYGKELAYNLCFEADFEEEHGIFVTIKNGHVTDSGYRMDAESPWIDRAE